MEIFCRFLPFRLIGIGLRRVVMGASRADDGGANGSGAEEHCYPPQVIPSELKNFSQLAQENFRQFGRLCDLQLFRPFLT